MINIITKLACSILHIDYDSDKGRELNQFIKFGLVGVSNTIISLAVYYIFVLINKDLYLLGNIVGFIVSVANSFYWNNRYVFKTAGQDRWLNRLLKTYLAYGGTAALSTGLLWLEVGIFKLSEILMPVINLLITIPLNYVINKFWAFKQEK